MSVVAALEAELKVLSSRSPALAASSLAATALALAAELDASGNSATSKSMCGRALLDVLNRLYELAPAEKLSDGVDDLKARRVKRRDGRAKAAG